MDNDSLAKIQELEQAVHTHTVQRQTYEQQLHELENAKEELQHTEEAYKIVGGIMVKSDAKQLLKEVMEQHTTATTRVVQLQKQEEKLRTQMNELQKKLIGDTHE